MECCFDSFSIYIYIYIWEKKDFLHYLVMNENFCGVILDVLLCLLTKLVFLPSQNIQYSSISTVLTSCKLFIVLWPIRHYQTDVTYRRHIYPVLLHSEGQGHLTSLYYCISITNRNHWQAWRDRLIMQLEKKKNLQIFLKTKIL